MKNYELCIDMGSCFTTIYKKNSGIVLREPSVVLIETIGKQMKVLDVGLNAQKHNGKLVDGQVLVRPIIEGVIKNAELTKKMINYFLGKIVKYSLIKPNIKLIVCLPISLNQKQYEDYKELFYSIGFAKIEFIYNSVCASLADNPYQCLNKANLFINIGGDKTEICAIVNNKIIDACSVNIGGSFVDNKIIESLHKTNNLSISQGIACKIKHEIASLYETDKSSMQIVAKDLATNSSITTLVSAQQLLSSIYDCYFKILQTIQAFINSQSVEMTQDIKNDGIFFYGGGSLITGLEKFAKKILGASVFVLDNPETLACVGSEKLFSDITLLQNVVEEN